MFPLLFLCVPRICMGRRWAWDSSRFYPSPTSPRLVLFHIHGFIPRPCTSPSLLTRPTNTVFKWVKGHEFNYGNIEADALADEAREGDSLVTPDEDD